MSPAGEYHFLGRCWCGLDHKNNSQWGGRTAISKSEVVRMTREQVVREIHDAIRSRDDGGEGD